jgi:mannose-6-phosphate isomerase-like protein (cupin superfamily)
MSSSGWRASARPATVRHAEKLKRVEGTMKTKLAVAALAAALPLAAAEPAGIAVWTSSELKDYGRRLAPRVNEKKLALEQLAEFGNHSTLVAHRQGDGEAEWHETQADIFVVQAGTATLVLGGEVVDGKATAPGEIRGPAIRGGRRHPLGAGDMVHIPARTPHQVLVPEGTGFTYVVIKVGTP